MGKLTALVIIVFTVVWLAPMCARLPTDLTPVATTPPIAPAVAPIVAPIVAAAAALTPETKPVVEPAMKAVADKPAVIVIAYGMKKMFPITDGRARISVRMRNDSDKKAVDARLTISAVRQGFVAETDKVNLPFTIDAGSSAYRGLFVTEGFVDALLSTAPEAGAELKWALTYRLEGDGPEVERCYRLRALPHTREPEGISWTALGATADCPK